MIKNIFNSRYAMSFFYKLHYFLEESVEYSRRKNDERYLNNEIKKDVIITKDVFLEGECQIESESIILGNVSIKSYSIIGFRDILFGGEISIGRYCQFAPYVSVYSSNHSLSTLTTYNNKRLFNQKLKELSDNMPVKIGNDVWVGTGTTILPGVNIGSGVIIGAGSVVTNDIPDYVVVGGNPARIIKKRFNDELIELLLNWQWWNLNPHELLEFESLFFIKLPESEKLLIQSIMDKIQEKN